MWIKASHILGVSFFLVVAANCVVSAADQSSSENPSLPAVCFWNPSAAVTLRHRSLTHDPSVAEPLASLCKSADADLKLGPFSVTDKTLLPPSGDKHDFSTLGRYYWPNPKTPDGMPWIRQDGKTNPDYYDGKIGDSQRFIDMVNSVVTLSRAYYLTDRDTYSDHAASLMRTWFIDPKTRMNTNARYAARFPGNWDGQCYGIHGTRELMDVADAIGLLKSSKTWTAADQEAMTKWFGEYLTWLTESDLGKEEGGQKNNHSLAYDCLVIRLAIFVGQIDRAKEILRSVPTKRLDPQIDSDGKMPLELARATPWEYTRYATEFLFRLGILGDRVGVDIWNYKSADGRGIRKAFDFLINNIEKPDGTIDGEILKKAIPDRVGAMLQVAAVIYHDPAYLKTMRRIGFEGDLTFREAAINGNLSVVERPAAIPSR